MSTKKVWYKVLDDKNELPNGRVMTVTAGHKGICLTHFEGKYYALENKCPHQGGPLGEGSIENGMLRCPWHGWDFEPCGGSAEGFDDGLPAFDLKIEGDTIFVGLDEEVPHETTISDVMVETMVNWGVNRVFGMVGHSNLGMADALRRQEEKGNLKFIGIRHEGAAAFAASAYGKLTGKPAACFAIAGPGATNMYTGLWDAKVDRAPILALTGQVATQVVGTGNFQEVDLVKAFDSVAQFNHRVEHRSKHGELMSLAIKHAIINRDVSHLTFPDEVQELAAAENEAIGSPEERITPMTIAPPKETFEKALQLLNQAKRPAIIVGHGARFHMKEIIALAEKLKCPVMTTFKGKGQISDHHALGCGVIGRSGTPIASWFMNEADLLLVIGASFSNHTGITYKKATIQIDFDPLALSKFHKVDAAVWGEISVTVNMLNEQLSNFENKFDHTAEVKERTSIWKAEKQKRLTEERGKGISSIAVFEALNETAPSNAVMCVDVGNNAYSFGRYYEAKENNTFLMSGYLGSIGFAYPAAIGAWAAVAGERPIIAVAGDGGFCQYLAEITTAVKYNMPIKAIILNNNELGKISKEQRAGEFDVWATDLVNPNFAEYANGCGALGIQVTEKSALNAALKQIFDHDGPALLEIKTDVGLI
jgi:thiamine pyrophosphate-dependent acetolactate synthase large subunit-like protein/nitrite reductase/ring-hydroxylating ferredoxin subunit